jgi:hypothetical protein
MNGSNSGSSAKLQPKKGFKKFLWRLFFTMLLVAGLLFYWHFYFVYDAGNREGILFKFSDKGNFFKTYEGEIVQPGLRPAQSGSINTNNFFFSVTKKKLADSLGKITGKNVLVHYSKYHGSLPWRGDNYNPENQEDGQYIVDSIITVSEAVNNSGL